MRGHLISTALLLGVAISAHATVVYQVAPAPPLTPPNVASWGFQATSTSELGNAINLTQPGQLTTITATMSSWALFSSWSTDPRYSANPSGFNHNLTLNVYNYNMDGSVGTLIATQTINALIPFRPEATTGCTGSGWIPTTPPDCYNGLAFNVDFDFTSANVIVPNQIIVSMAYNTGSYGANPLGVTGAYDSLNLGIDGSPNIGSNIYPFSAYMNAANGFFYNDGGAGGTGTFRLDFYGTGGGNSWEGFSPMFQVNTVPEPQTWAMLVGALALLAARRQRR